VRLEGRTVREDLHREFARLVRESPHNLLSKAGLEELESRHIPESRRFCAALPEADRILDLGSGGGLPGVVIAIERPRTQVHLVEATGKKAAFLSSVATALHLNIVVHAVRAEALARSGTVGTFHVVTARAVAPLERLVPLAAPFLAAGGALYAIKGSRWPEELAAAASAIGALGLEVIETPTEAGDAGPGPTVIVIGKTS
jgi:16S rRNA (guanine527-N7)-methyltransferase